MIKPEQIPVEVVKAYKQHLENNTWTTYEAAIAAALNAWPGVWTEGYTTPHLILPMHTEANDD